jgi:ECF transporter S component (folate family)
MKKSIKNLVLASIFVALAIIFTRLVPLQLGNYLRLGVGDLPLLLAGIILGPFYGAAVGAVADVLGFMIAPMGDFFIPGITLSAALWGFIPGVAVHFIFKKKSFAAILTSAIACGILVDIISTPFWLSLAYGSLTYFAMLPVQAANAGVMIVVNTALATVLIRALQKGRVIDTEIKQSAN